MAERQKASPDFSANVGTLRFTLHPAVAVSFLAELLRDPNAAPLMEESEVLCQGGVVAVQGEEGNCFVAFPLGVPGKEGWREEPNRRLARLGERLRQRLPLVVVMPPDGLPGDKNRIIVLPKSRLKELEGLRQGAVMRAAEQVFGPSGAAGFYRVLRYLSDPLRLVPAEEGGSIDEGSCQLIDQASAPEERQGEQKGQKIRRGLGLIGRGVSVALALGIVATRVASCLGPVQGKERRPLSFDGQQLTGSNQEPVLTDLPDQTVAALTGCLSQHCPTGVWPDKRGGCHLGKDASLVVQPDTDEVLRCLAGEKVFYFAAWPPNEGEQKLVAVTPADWQAFLRKLVGQRTVATPTSEMRSTPETPEPTELVVQGVTFQAQQVASEEISLSELGRLVLGDKEIGMGYVDLVTTTDNETATNNKVVLVVQKEDKYYQITLDPYNERDAAFLASLSKSDKPYIGLEVWLKATQEEFASKQVDFKQFPWSPDVVWVMEGLKVVGVIRLDGKWVEISSNFGQSPVPEYYPATGINLKDQNGQKISLAQFERHFGKEAWEQIYWQLVDQANLNLRKRVGDLKYLATTIESSYPEGLGVVVLGLFSFPDGAPAGVFRDEKEDTLYLAWVDPETGKAIFEPIPSKISNDPKYRYQERDLSTLETEGVVKYSANVRGKIIPLGTWNPRTDEVVIKKPQHPEPTPTPELIAPKNFEQVASALRNNKSWYQEGGYRFDSYVVAGDQIVILVGGKNGFSQEEAQAMKGWIEEILVKSPKLSKIIRESRCSFIARDDEGLSRLNYAAGPNLVNIRSALLGGIELNTKGYLKWGDGNDVKGKRLQAIFHEMGRLISFEKSGDLANETIVCPIDRTAFEELTTSDLLNEGEKAAAKVMLDVALTYCE